MSSPAHRSLRLALSVPPYSDALRPCTRGFAKFVVENKETPAYNAQAFRKAGQYEITGHYFGELDPEASIKHDHYRFGDAPRNAHAGMVEYSGTFAIAKPIDLTKSNGVCFIRCRIEATAAR